MIELSIREEVSLSDFNSLGLQSTAQFFFELTDVQLIPDLFVWSKTKNLPLLWLGGGSNLVLGETVPGLVVRMATEGIQIIERDASSALVRVAAGENWHQFVIYSVQQGLHGLENLALIPGTVGAAPVQNIGAYGVEVGRRIVSVEVFDCSTQEMKSISVEDCQFGYRDSIFKRTPNRYVILSVDFRLDLKFEPVLGYQALNQELGERGLKQPDATDLVKAVCAVRQKKLPDPKVLGNAGSFFKNPVISLDDFSKISEGYPNIPNYPDAAGVKLAAGWLIEQAGWRGQCQGPVGMHEDQALVLVNFGGASRQDVEHLADKVRQSVLEKFGVLLEQEPLSYP